MCADRRGNWITLKLKKLMKSSSRENVPESTQASEAEPHHYGGSFISSDGSGGSASTSAGDFTSQQRGSSEYVNLKLTASGL